MRLATTEQAKEIDDLSQRVYALSGEILMEAAGAMAAREIDQAYFPELKRGKTSIICGPGNNGADGLVTARHLHATGHRDLNIFLVAPSGKRSNLFLQQLNRLDLQGIKVIDLEQEPEKWEQLKSSRLIIDALFGVGLTRELEGDFLTSVQKINSVQVPTVSLDVPSGLDSDTGQVRGTAVRANMTLTFGMGKPGFFVSEGPAHVGTLRVLPIGFPYECLRGVATSHFLYNERLAKRYLPQRKDTSNKSNHGKLLVLAGSPEMWGAGVLVSHAGFRMGCGYVHWASHEKPLDSLSQCPEVLLEEFSPDLLSTKTFDAVVIGSGLGVKTDTAKMLKALLDSKIKNVVVDADAISVAAEEKMFPLPSSWVLTPHAGELSRLLKISSHEIENNRFSAAQAGSELTGGHLLLKGFRTVLAFEGRFLIIGSGNSSLAKAGTGDVLSGMIGSLLAQGVETLQAAATGAYVHGRLADEWVRQGHSSHSLVASDLTEHLPKLLARISGGSLF